MVVIQNDSSSRKATFKSWSLLIFRHLKKTFFTDHFSTNNRFMSWLINRFRCVLTLWSCLCDFTGRLIARNLKSQYYVESTGSCCFEHAEVLWVTDCDSQSVTGRLKFKQNLERIKIWEIQVMRYESVIFLQWMVDWDLAVAALE